MPPEINNNAASGIENTMPGGILTVVGVLFSSEKYTISNPKQKIIRKLSWLISREVIIKRYYSFELKQEKSL